MSEKDLRDAAEGLRSLIGTPDTESEDFAIPGPWGVSGRPGKFEIVPELDESYDVVARTEYDIEAQYIAMMHPGVGLALADLLDMLAGDREQADVDGGTWDHGVMPLVRALLGKP